ncbi:Glycoside hydrolase superfamily [Macrophomina phaseolina MS6]|uniref:Glycoside hydrolase superfamily n=2 Tax=Macrophomina phaseolina TaxID=35725 RepID=K2RNP0_MACPH|nr:Glycoside hydrolase superfamily [Macrophomina phaseolina MS6]KAH7062681.1 glycoside hydrolase superfamily [Macrophomina phaseolina]
MRSHTRLGARSGAFTQSGPESVALSLCRIASFALILASVSAIELSPPANVPEEASAVLDQSYVSFAIEGRDFADYSGNDATPNEFSRNMFSTFSRKTGTPLYLRVGGTTQDHFRYDASQDEPVRFENPDLPTFLNLFANITVGKSWTEGFRQFHDVVWDLQVFLARKNLSNAVEFAKDCVEAIGIENLNALEIGNEPDLYNASGFFPNQTDRPSSYQPPDYVAEFTEFAEALESSLTLGAGPNFQALGYSNFVADPWNERNAFEAGLSPDLVKSISEHYYQSRDGRGLGATLMNKTAIRSFTDARFKERIEYMRSTYPDIPFLIAEVGSALGNGTGIRDFDLTASLGTALWTVDWLLYAVTIGVTRVNMQLGSRFPFSPWLGSTTVINNQTLPPQTLGSFYGNVFVADFIGSDGNFRVAELSVDDDNISAYAGYHSDKLTKIALVNLELWRESYGTERPVSSVTLRGLEGVKAVRVQKLTGPDGGSQAKDITWAGTQWTAESTGLPVAVRDDSVLVIVESGSVEICIQASEAVLVSFVPNNYLAMDKMASMVTGPSDS